MTIKEELALGLGFLLLSFFFFAMQWRSSQEALAAEIAPEILRFHILANSDSHDDQALKLEVRDQILEYMKELPETAADKEAVCGLLAERLNDIEAVADAFIADSGYDYRTKAELVTCHFPPRIYGALTLPEGSYDALRISIGRGNGRNWWCVLYPQLCFTDVVTNHVTAESEQQLKEAVKKNNGLPMEDRRPEIRFLIQDLAGLLPPSRKTPSPETDQAWHFRDSSSAKDKQLSSADIG